MELKYLETDKLEIYDLKKKSSNKYFDDSVFKAVKKSNPLPKLPKGYPFYKVALRFTPSGLR